MMRSLELGWGRELYFEGAFWRVKPNVPLVVSTMDYIFLTGFIRLGVGCGIEDPNILTAL